MAGKGAGAGEGTAKLDGQIACIKYTLFCFNIMSWVSCGDYINQECWLLLTPKHKRLENGENLHCKWHNRPKSSSKVLQTAGVMTNFLVLYFGPTCVTDTTVILSRCSVYYQKCVFVGKPSLTPYKDTSIMYQWYTKYPANLIGVPMESPSFPPTTNLNSMSLYRFLAPLYLPSLFGLEQNLDSMSGSKCWTFNPFILESTS